MSRPPVLSREFVLANRRRRCGLAAADAAHELGLQHVTVDSICRLSRMARNSFYDAFPNLADCFAYAVELGYEKLAAPLRRACLEEEWPARVDLALGGLFVAASTEPRLTEMHLVHSHAIAGADPERDLEATTALLAEIFAGGREAARDTPAPEPAPLTEELLARAVLSLTAAAVCRGEAARLCERHAGMVLLVHNAFSCAEKSAVPRAKATGLESATPA